MKYDNEKNNYGKKEVIRRQILFNQLFFGVSNLFEVGTVPF